MWGMSGKNIILKHFNTARLQILVLTGELWTYLAELSEQAQERLEIIMEQMKTSDGVNEKWKCTQQMEGVQRYNHIHNRAEEMLLYEMTYL